MSRQSWILYQRDAERLSKQAFEALVREKMDPRAPSGPTGLAGFNSLPLESPQEGHGLSGRTSMARVGIWDVNSLAGDIGLIASTLNEVQKRFCFFEVSGAVPASLISDKARVLAWAKQGNFRLGSRERSELRENTIAEDFYPQAGKLRKQLRLHYIIGLTRSMIAFVEDGALHTNYFASYSDPPGREMLVSSYDLRKYAVRARRPLEAALGGVVISILLVEISPRLEYHEDAGCLFDFNEYRDSIVESIREARIEDRCLRKIRPDSRDAAEAMVQALRVMPLSEKGLPKDKRKRRK